MAKDIVADPAVKSTCAALFLSHHMTILLTRTRQRILNPGRPASSRKSQP